MIGPTKPNRKPAIGLFRIIAVKYPAIYKGDTYYLTQWAKLGMIEESDFDIQRI